MLKYQNKLIQFPISLLFLGLFLANSCYARQSQYKSPDYEEILSPSSSSSNYSPYQHNPYSFGYDVEDSYGNKQWRQEKSQDPHVVHGSYGYKDKAGIYREVHYVADKNGFRASIKTNEPGTVSKDSSYVRMEAYAPPQASTNIHSHSQVPAGSSTVPVYASLKSSSPTQASSQTHSHLMTTHNSYSYPQGY